MDLRPNNPLLVACRTRREWNDDDAVVGCRLIVASSFRAFYSGEHEMRRVSKREIGFRFGLASARGLKQSLKASTAIWRFCRMNGTTWRARA
jgi:hypothetical protein